MYVKHVDVTVETFVRVGWEVCLRKTILLYVRRQDKDLSVGLTFHFSVKLDVTIILLRVTIRSPLVLGTLLLHCGWAVKTRLS